MLLYVTWRPYGLLRKGSQEGHLDFHTAPELSCRGNTKSGFVGITGPAQSGSQAAVVLTSSAEANEVRVTVVESCPVNTKQSRLCALHGLQRSDWTESASDSRWREIEVDAVQLALLAVWVTSRLPCLFLIFVLFVCLSFYTLSVSSSLSLFEATLCDRFLRYIIFV